MDVIVTDDNEPTPVTVPDTADVSDAIVAGATATAVAESVSDAITDVTRETIDTLREDLVRTRNELELAQMRVNSLTVENAELKGQLAAAPVTIIIEETPIDDSAGDGTDEVTVVESETPPTSPAAAPKSDPAPDKMPFRGGRRPFGRR